MNAYAGNSLEDYYEVITRLKEPKKMGKKEFPLNHVLTVYSGIVVCPSMQFADLLTVLHFVTQDKFSIDWAARAADETKRHVLGLLPWLSTACERINELNGSPHEIVAYVARLEREHGSLVTLYPDFSYTPPTEMAERVHAAKHNMQVIEMDE